MSHSPVCPCCAVRGRNPLGAVILAALVAVAGTAVTIWLGSLGRTLVYLAAWGLGLGVLAGIVAVARSAYLAGREPGQLPAPKVTPAPAAEPVPDVAAEAAPEPHVGWVPVVHQGGRAA